MPTVTAKTQNAVPFLKWAGGKTQLLSELRKYIPQEFGTYIEPFVGGGALFFDLQPEHSLLSDSNSELINAYQVIQRNVEDLIEALKVHSYSSKYFYDVRSLDPSSLSPVERAARFIYLNKTCFNGLYRVNRKGEFNVPIGRYKNPRICEEEKLRSASGALKSATILCVDYQALLAEHAAYGDLIYIDPPYHPISQYSDFKRYTPDQFREDDQMTLRDCIIDLKQKGCTVIASNSHCPFILDLYGNFTVKIVNVHRSINCRGEGRVRSKEVIIV